jgi:hypothetical protein
LNYIPNTFKPIITNKSFSEMHRTQSDFDDNLTFKVKFVGYPGAYKNIKAKNKWGEKREKIKNFFQEYFKMGKLNYQ